MTHVVGDDHERCQRLIYHGTRCNLKSVSNVKRSRIKGPFVGYFSGEGDLTTVRPEPGGQAETADDPLAEFHAEMDELGALEGETGQREGAAEERVPTPDPEDQRFEDDDGTIYVWDPALRKFVEEGTAPGGGAYNVDEMTFEMDEEIIPEYNPPAVSPVPTYYTASVPSNL